MKTGKQTDTTAKKKKKCYEYTKKFSASVDHIWMRWKTFNIIQLTIMINSPKKLRIENSLNFIKRTFQKFIMNTILNGENLDVFPLK